MTTTENAHRASRRIKSRMCRLARASSLLVMFVAGHADGQDDSVRPAAARSLARVADVKTTAPFMDRPAPPPMEHQPPVRPLKPEMSPAAVEDRLHQILQSTVLISHPGDGSIWARGLNYKASFSTDGFTYIPYLGADSPRNYPIGFAIASMTIGGNPVDFSASAAPVIDGQIITFNRGPVVEKYVLSPNSVEQTFTINAEVTGDLVIRLNVTGDLPIRAVDDQVQFGGEHAKVHYSQAVAIDDGDLRQPLATTVRDGQIQITLPKYVASAARGKLVIDPMIQMQPVEVGSLDRSADIAYNVSNDQCCVSYERAYSAIDHDVYCEMIDHLGQPIAGTMTTIDFTTVDWRNPRIANNNASDQFLVVAGVGVSPNRSIWGAIRAAGSTSVSPQFQISDPGYSGDKYRPDVGGDSVVVGPSYYLVVWQRDYSPTDHDIHARLVATSAVTAGAAILIDNSPGTLDDHPTVSNSGGAARRWMVAWDRRLNEFDDGDIFGAAVNFDGAIADSTFPIDTSGFSDYNPSVSSRTLAGTYMVAYESAGSVYLRVLDGTATVASTLVGGSLPKGPSVDTDGTKFTVAYSVVINNPGHDIGIQAFCHIGSNVYPAEGRRALDIYFLDSSHVKVCNRYSGGGAGSEALAAWDAYYGNNEFLIYSGLYRNPVYCCQTDVAPLGGNNVTNIDDLLAVISQWTPICVNCPADVNGDLTVNIDDLLAVIQAWGPCP